MTPIACELTPNAEAFSAVACARSPKADELVPEATECVPYAEAFCALAWALAP